MNKNALLINVLNIVIAVKISLITVSIVKLIELFLLVDVLNPIEILGKLLVKQLLHVLALLISNQTLILQEYANALLVTTLALLLLILSIAHVDFIHLYYI